MVADARSWRVAAAEAIAELTRRDATDSSARSGRTWGGEVRWGGVNMGFIKIYRADVGSSSMVVVGWRFVKLTLRC